MDAAAPAPHPPARATTDVPVVILAGGLGTRLAEETELRPKPMVEIGGRPILWHIMKSYAAFGFHHFVVALGFKGDMIKQFFLDYQHVMSDIRVQTASAQVERLSDQLDDWTVDLVDTGVDANTGGRVKRLTAHLPDKLFCLTYGDGVSDVDLADVLAFHRAHGRRITVTAVRPPARYGGLLLDGARVREFVEKSQLMEGWVNGGFMVVNRGVLDQIEGDATSFEREVIEPLAAAGEVMAYTHGGYWQSMDTLRDVRMLRSLWDRGEAPWKVW